ncbi:MAG: tRNA (guanosine(37)-N1)-methyltransferase TrmD [Fidelibacterota bacterium]
MEIYILTSFPGVFSGPLNNSIIKRAVDNDLVRFHIIDIRGHTENKHRQIDDYPYGGGPGMILKPEPIFNAFDAVMGEIGEAQTPRVIYPTPQGVIFNQQLAKSLSEENLLIFICGRYKGVDERVIERLVTDEISIGDYIVSGGELPSLVIIDALVRIIPGAIGDPESAASDSFSGGLLDCPHYTRPEVFRGMKVPDVLLSGDHKRIREWRHRKKLERTIARRADLLSSYHAEKREKRGG